eukprot:CAMPEP_0170517056 /NCGR_PEP_ID=MMETSP0209-20121228/3153_1 /TAXON_ID=665100 ORGANISM="Litonotus pictus, Strain P1" /NCGR_SAMPLE_ID=MMETSP0209 /ASSEMBLY_ACC=CAM_ASM_000301 /LENGTH=374 /DNA_ID=CAMNT_0010802205 /DNA_START=431 /DNA_END=1555 /DNA_ORIENTATION=-
MEEDTDIQTEDNLNLEEKPLTLSELNNKNSIIKIELERLNKQVELLTQEYDNYESLLHLFNELINGEEFIKEASELGEESLVTSTKQDMKAIVKRVNEEREEIINAMLDDEEQVDSINLEIKSASGGTESALFAADLLEAYKFFCNNQGFDLVEESYESLEANGKKGCKSGKFKVTGDHVFRYFKFESGVHKVQRVPVTENKGRVHSSTCQVIVIKDSQDSFQDKELDERDLRYEFMRAQGKGGQHVNKTESACRITHLPSGISAHISDSREQHENKIKALAILKQKINQIKKQEYDDALYESRKSLGGTGNLSEKIRTYNFPDSRVTDHRLSVTKYGIEKMLQGNMLSEFVELNIKNEKDEKLSKLMEKGMSK